MPDRIFDAAIIDELRLVRGSGDGDLFSELADQFLQQMPAWIRDLEQAARENDNYEVRRQAHRLLGLCRQIGAERMAALCVRLEHVKDEMAEDLLLQEVSRPGNSTTVTWASDARQFIAWEIKGAGDSATLVLRSSTDFMAHAAAGIP
jgi:HPt (histidine-containing phosphotransfer) domain-containing protein